MEQQESWFASTLHIQRKGREVSSFFPLIKIYCTRDLDPLFPSPSSQLSLSLQLPLVLDALSFLFFPLFPSHSVTVCFVSVCLFSFTCMVFARTHKNKKSVVRGRQDEKRSPSQEEGRSALLLSMLFPHFLTWFSGVPKSLRVLWVESHRDFIYNEDLLLDQTFCISVCAKEWSERKENSSLILLKFGKEREGTLNELLLFHSRVYLNLKRKRRTLSLSFLSSPFFSSFLLSEWALRRSSFSHFVWHKRDLPQDLVIFSYIEAIVCLFSLLCPYSSFLLVFSSPPSRLLVFLLSSEWREKNSGLFLFLHFSVFFILTSPLMDSRSFISSSFHSFLSSSPSFHDDVPCDVDLMILSLQMVLLICFINS